MAIVIRHAAQAADHMPWIVAVGVFKQGLIPMTITTQQLIIVHSVGAIQVAGYNMINFITFWYNLFTNGALVLIVCHHSPSVI